MTFKQRYAAPEAGNPYYTHVSGGGYNECVKINGYSVLPNCVGYAYGRFMEECEISKCNLSRGDAENWFGYKDGYPRGSEPKPGAVMCWRGGVTGNPVDGRGHVAIVEEVHADGAVTVSMSNWSETGSLPYWERKTYAKPYNTKTLTFQGFIYNPCLNGCDIAVGASDIEINGHSYSVYRQSMNEETVVLSAGINKVLPIKQLDADVYVNAKITGANYFQMRDGQSDPVNTTYGDQSAPLNGSFTEVPNQNTTLYFDCETGEYGDCTGVHIDSTHNVFSPAIVYPREGNYQFARMVGIDHVNTVSRYTFAIRLYDGAFILGIANLDMTPKQIATDFRFAIGADMESISFLDGGGSAQMGRWNGNAFEYVRDTGREVPSAVAIVSTKPIQSGINSDTSAETGGNGETDMNNETNANTGVMEPVKDDNWTDPEPQAESTGATIAKRFFSVKSIVTLTLTGVFSYLAINGQISNEQFMSIFTMCISFFFGYSFEKKNGK